MRRIFTSIVAILCFFMSWAQDGYYYGKQFIELKADSAKGLFIQAKAATDVKEIRAVFNASKVEICEISYKQFLTKDKSLLNRTGLYHSPIYYTKSSKNIIILPQIAVCLNGGILIDDILEQYTGILSVKASRDSIYYLNCNVNKAADVLSIVSHITAKKGVVWCEPDMYSDIYISNSNPMYGNQYYLKNTGQFGSGSTLDINVEPIWSITNGNGNIAVAIVDTGVDLSHEDLAGTLLQGYTVGNPTGYGAPQLWTEQDKAHGTACAGIVGAIDNEVGVKGVASGVKLLPVNIVPNKASGNYNGFATNFQIATAIRWAYQRTDILSCSWGGGSPSNDIASAIREARTNGRNGKGTVVVFSSGNKSSEVSFPGNVDGVITVGAIDPYGNICDYSNTGKSLDLVAFGKFITTTYATDEKTYNPTDYCSDFGGTSAACPQVAGVAALMLSANPSLDEAEVRSILQETAVDLGDKARDDTYGYGLVNASKAVGEVLLKKTTIDGPIIVGNSAQYSLRNLPENSKVRWSGKSSSSYIMKVPRIANDIPAKNIATVYNQDYSPFKIDLSANIFLDNGNIGPFKRSLTISGESALYGFYAENYDVNNPSYEKILVDSEFGDINTATPYSEVYVYSDNFYGRNVSYTSPLGAGYCPVNGSSIRFEMPELNEGETMDFTVSGGEISRVLNFRFSNSNHRYIKYGGIKIAALGGNKYTVRIETAKSKDIVNNNTELIIDTYNATNMNRVAHIESKGNSCTFDAANIHPGIYIILASYNGKTYSEKLLIK